MVGPKAANANILGVPLECPCGTNLIHFLDFKLPFEQYDLIRCYCHWWYCDFKLNHVCIISLLIIIFHLEVLCTYFEIHLLCLDIPKGLADVDVDTTDMIIILLMSWSCPAHVLDSLAQRSVACPSAFFSCLFVHQWPSQNNQNAKISVWLFRDGKSC